MDHTKLKTDCMTKKLSMNHTELKTDCMTKK